jgi:hypothetical protein
MTRDDLGLGALGAHLAALLVLAFSASAAAQEPPPGCPPTPGLGACQIHASATGSYILADRFTPNADVRFEVYDAPGGRVIYGPVTRRTDARGQRNAPGEPKLVPGNRVVVTDLATGTVKTLDVDPVTVTRVDLGADTASGTANPGVLVGVHVESRWQPQAEASAVADAQGRWSVDFRAQGFDLVAGTNVTATVSDAEGDTTHASVGPGCTSGSWGACAILADPTNDWVGVDAMTPSADVRLEIYASKGGRRIYGPVTLHTKADGTVDFLEVAFTDNIDVAAGVYVVVRDLASRTTKALELTPLSIDRVDPATDVIEGTALTGTTVSIGGAGFKPFDLQAGPGNAWRYDFHAIGYDVTDVDAFRVSSSDEDGDFTAVHGGSPVPDCIPDATTVCGTAGPEALRTATATAAAAAGLLRSDPWPSARAAVRRWKVSAGGSGDTVVATVDRTTRSLDVDTGRGRLDKVVVRARRRASGRVVVHGASRRLEVVLPAHAWRIAATVFGTQGSDRVSTRRFGGSGRSGGGYRLLGKGGADRLTGGDGADRLDGGSGNDVLAGGPGRDALIGGPGRDTCRAGAGDVISSCEVVRR